MKAYVTKIPAFFYGDSAEVHLSIPKGRLPSGDFLKALADMIGPHGEILLVPWGEQYNSNDESVGVSE